MNETKSDLFDFHVEKACFQPLIAKLIILGGVTNLLFRLVLKIITKGQLI